VTAQERAFVVKLLRRKQKQISSTGFATDRPEVSCWELQAIESAVEHLERKTRFELSPFV
jgi:hypothetical protein